jgi:hypothetical protein
LAEPIQETEQRYELESICGRLDQNWLLVRCVGYHGEFAQEEKLLKHLPMYKTWHRQDRRAAAAAAACAGGEMLMLVVLVLLVVLVVLVALEKRKQTWAWGRRKPMNRAEARGVAKRELAG